MVKMKEKELRKRTRSDGADEEADPPVVKVKKDDVKGLISDVEFKFLLRDPQTVTQGLEGFLASTAAFNDGVSCPDFIASYLRGSHSSIELFTLLDPTGSQLKVHDISLVFECLEQILTRIRTDLSNFLSTGEAVVQKILAGHMGQLYSCLRDQNRSKAIKAGLELLISMVMMSERSRKAVMTRLNFGHINFPPLFKRRNTKDPKDVRSCAVLLTLAFLLDSDHSSVIALVQQKSFLHLTIAGLKFDHRDMVVDVLATLLDKVVKCPAVSKTDKVKLFSENVLRQVCELYSWQGPEGWLRSGKKSDHKETDTQLGSSSVEDSGSREEVAEVAHQFLLEICCSRKFGVNFQDKSVGTGSRNQNQLLGHFAQWTTKDLSVSRKSELTQRILCTCPDLLKSVLTTLCPSLSPRWSDKWTQLMDWMIKLYDSMSDIPAFLTHQDSQTSDPARAVTMATVYCLPPPKVTAVLSQAFKQTDIRIQYGYLQLVAVLARKCVCVHHQLSTVYCEQLHTKASVLDMFTVCVLKTLPAVSQLMTCVDRLTVNASKSHERKLESSLTEDGSNMPGLSQQATTLLQILTYYQALSPSLLCERPKEMTRIVEMVSSVVATLDKTDGQQDDEESDEMEDNEDDDKEEEEENLLPQLYLLKLMADCDVRKLALGREGLLEKLLVAATQSKKYQDVSIQLLCRMLGSLEVFCGQEKELELWLSQTVKWSSKYKTGQSAVSGDKVDMAIQSFIANCLVSVINNPSPYIDRMLEAESDQLTQASAKDTLDMSSKESTAQAVQDVLMMDDQQLDQLLTASRTVDDVKGFSLAVSPVTVTVLDHLQSKTSEEVKNYVCQCLVHLLHHVRQPQVLASMVRKNSAELPVSVRQYLDYWTGQQSTSPLDEAPSPDMFGSFTSTLVNYHWNLGMIAEQAKQAKQLLLKEMKLMSNREKLTALRQLLMYSEDILQGPGKIKNCKRLEVYMAVVKALIVDLSLDSGQQADSGMNVSKNQQMDSSIDMANSSSLTTHMDTTNMITQLDLLDKWTKDGSDPSPAVSALTSLTSSSSLLTWSFSVPGHTRVKQSSPKSDVLMDVSSLVSSLVKSVLEVVSGCQWFRQEKELVRTVLSTLMDKICKQRDKLLPQLESDCCLCVQLLSVCLDLQSVCQCIVSILQLHWSALVVTGQKSSPRSPQEGISDHQLTPSGQLLCVLLHQAQTEMEKFHAVISTSTVKESNAGENLGTSRMSDLQKDSVQTPAGPTIRTKLSFEEMTEQKWLDLTSVFVLVLQCKDKRLHNFARFLLNCEPANSGHQSRVDKLLKSLVTSKSNEQDEKLLSALFRNSHKCFCQAGDWLKSHIQKVVKQERWSLLESYLEASLSFEDGCTETVEAIKVASYVHLKSSKMPGCCGHPNYWRCLALVVAQHDCQFQQLLTDRTSKYIAEGQLVQTGHFKVLEVTTRFYLPSSTIRSRGQRSSSPRCQFLDLCLCHLVILTKENTAGPSDVENYIVDLVMQLLTELPREELDCVTSHWGQLVNTILSHELTSPRLLQLLTALAPLVYPTHQLGSSSTQDTQAVVSAASVLQMCTGHVMFDTVMTSQQKRNIRDELVKFVYCLTQLEPSCCQSIKDITPWVAAYNASLSLTDQRLLVILEKCCVTSEGHFECPLLWGHRSVEQQNISKLLGSSLDKQVGTQQVIDQLDGQALDKSILAFPLRRKQKDQNVVDASHFKSRAECCDPNFLLRLFVQILSPDKMVPVRKFVESGCLSYLLIALSSHDTHNRLLAYQALNDFYLHAEGSRWREKTEITFVLDVLNASRSKDGQKLPYLVALFFARVVKLFLYPADPLYMPIFRFLLAKPEIDLWNVPEFYQLFYSSANQHKTERCWMLSLLADGMRETSDYRLIQNKYIFKIVMNFFHSPVSSVQSQRLILQLLTNACGEKSVAVDLVNHHGLLSWLSAVVQDLERNGPHSQLLFDLTHNLWVSLTTSRFVSINQKQRRLEGRETSGLRAEEEEEDVDQTVSAGPSTLWSAEQPRSTIERGQHSGNDHQKSAVVNVPKSTIVEMCLIAKQLIWHVRSCPAGLNKLVEVLYSILSMDESSGNQEGLTTVASGRSRSSQGSAVQPSLQQHCPMLVLSSTEACLLLYNVAVAVDNRTMLSACREILTSSVSSIDGMAGQPGSKLGLPDYQLRKAKVEDAQIHAVNEHEEIEEEGEGTRTLNITNLETEENINQSVVSGDKQDGRQIVTDKNSVDHRHLFDMCVQIVHRASAVHLV